MRRLALIGRAWRYRQALRRVEAAEHVTWARTLRKPAPASPDGTIGNSAAPSRHDRKEPT